MMDEITARPVRFLLDDEKGFELVSQKIIMARSMKWSGRNEREAGMVIRIVFRNLLAAIATLVCLGAQSSFAQDRAGLLQGVVKDAKGAPVSGAFVKMRNNERRLTFMVISQE